MLFLIRFEHTSLLELSLGAFDIFLLLFLIIVSVFLVIVVHRHVFVSAILILILDLLLVVFIFFDLVSGKFALNHLCLIIMDELSIRIIHVLIGLLLIWTLGIFISIGRHLRLLNLLFVLILFLLLTLFFLLLFLLLLLLLPSLQLL